jgi:2-polyprenyl-6-methoxyphenol hydroxylase-like FAD-dependent oxidoreductase
MSHSLFGEYATARLSTSANNQHDFLDSARGVVTTVPVLIIGGGPTGLLQAYLLSRLGVCSLVVERHLERTDAPKAHALSPRSLEICRQFGLDMGHIRRLGTQRDDARWVNFQTTLSGIPLGRLPYERMDTEVLDVTPEMIHNIPQPTFEQYISEELKKQSTAKVWKGVSFLSLEQKKDAVTTLLEDRSTGNTYKVESQFVIACDGARSQVREFVGIKTDHENSSTSKHNSTLCSQANIT